MAKIAVAFAERAAIAEFDGRLSRAEAERQALVEVIDRRLADLPDGIFGELVAADRRRRHPALQSILNACDLVGCRAAAWGFADIVIEGKTYRPAAPGELGHPAIVVPSVVDGVLEDLVAEDLHTRRRHSRLDVAAVVGGDEVEQAKARHFPLLIFDGLAAWLRSKTRGAVIVDWQRASAELDGVPAILTTRELAGRLRRATTRCCPHPVIAVPRGAGVAHAA